MILWSPLLCGMPGYKANYFFRLLLLVIILPVGRGFFEARSGGPGVGEENTEESLERGQGRPMTQSA